MKRNLVLILSLAGGLACGGSGGSTGASAPPNPAVQQISMVVQSKPDDTQPADLTGIDLSQIDPNDQTAFDPLFH